MSPESGDETDYSVSKELTNNHRVSKKSKHNDDDTKSNYNANSYCIHNTYMHIPAMHTGI